MISLSYNTYASIKRDETYWELAFEWRLLQKCRKEIGIPTIKRNAYMYV